MSTTFSAGVAIRSLVAGLLAFTAGHTVLAIDDVGPGRSTPQAANTFVEACSLERLQAVADATTAGITIGEVPNIISGRTVPGGVKYVAATDALPAHCQVSGSFVTHPASGKTANFLATLPLSWNGRYLQYGCFGHCGFFLFNDATHPQVNLVAQGKPGDSLRRGYASFATDGGHESQHRIAWAITASGRMDREAVDDFLYHSTRVLAQSAKVFISAFYSELSGDSRTISHAYFTGCSGGGRDGLVAASHFPEEFDGIIVGSPNANMIGVNIHSAALEIVQNRTDGALSPALVEKINAVALAKCDGLDGVVDGLIQNPAACDFDPDRDLPLCNGGESTGICFTRQQLDSVSTALTAVTDEEGNVIQPGLSISDLRISAPDDTHPPGETLRVFAFENDPAFSLDTFIQLGSGGPGDITHYRATVSAQEASTGMAAARMGIGNFPDSADRLIQQDRKLLIWHNLSDDRLTPYLSFNHYRQLAERHGGYGKLQDNIRLFSLPGTGHCGIGGAGPASFDALAAMEKWVENGRAPNALVAAHYPGQDFSQAPSRTMPLCKFPEMARYRGEGDIREAANWFCPEGDESMLNIGASGRRAGVGGKASPAIAPPPSKSYGRGAGTANPTDS